MNVREVIRARRAIRSYTPERLDEATVRAQLEEAVLAPSAMNAQPWAFAVVQDVAELRRYSDRAKSMLLALAADDAKGHRYRDLLGDPAFNIFYDASTLVVIPAGGAAIAAIIVGHPASAPPPVPRAAPRILSWSR